MESNIFNKGCDSKIQDIDEGQFGIHEDIVFSPKPINSFSLITIVGQAEEASGYIVPYSGDEDIADNVPKKIIQSTHWIVDIIP